MDLLTRWVMLTLPELLLLQFLISKVSKELMELINYQTVHGPLIAWVQIALPILHLPTKTGILIRETDLRRSFVGVHVASLNAGASFLRP